MSIYASDRDVTSDDLTEITQKQRAMGRSSSSNGEGGQFCRQASNPIKAGHYALPLNEGDGFVIALLGFFLIPISFIVDIIMGNNYLSSGLFNSSYITVGVGIIIMFASKMEKEIRKFRESIKEESQ